MQIIRSMDGYENNRNSVIALGMFDGLHLGHKKILQEVVRISQSKGLESIVYTYSNHPRTITGSSKPYNQIVSVEEKVKLISDYGIDKLVLLEFDGREENTLPVDFVCDTLVDTLKMSHIVVGFNNRFGKGAKGDIALLKSLAKKYDYDLTVIDKVMVNNEVVSSTLIRKLNKMGNFKKIKLLTG